MNAPRIAIFLLLGAVVGVPFFLRPLSVRERVPAGTRTLVAVTPHVQQIQFEFGRAFSRWHERVYHEPAHIDWRQPGGTSEILRQLESQYFAAAKAGAVDTTDPKNPRLAPGMIPADLVFGGGSYDHGRLKKGVSVRGPDGVDHVVPMSEPAGFPQSRLDEWYGENRVGAGLLYEPGQYWLGTALSSFGIVYNRELCREIGVPEPERFDALADPRLSGWVVLTDPRQSGSVNTAMDAILTFYGWDEGWRVLRAMSANARSFTNVSSRPPVDVAQGDAAAGLAIDFYGRGQAQTLADITPPGAPVRVGYVDPKGAASIDADPVSILRGGPHPELARRFVEFCLTDEAQALWQLPVRSERSPRDAAGQPLGPERYVLRRSPVRREFYARYADWLIDRVDPFTIAAGTPPRGWRDAIGPIIGAAAIDNMSAMHEAWRSLHRAKLDPSVPPAARDEMERLFFSFPPHRLPDGTTVEFSSDTLPRIIASWKDPNVRARSQVAYTGYYRDTYRRVIDMARGAAHKSDGIAAR